MSAHFEIQARLLKRRAGIVVRDEVRRARADTIDDAVTAARGFTADGFTTWIYRVEIGTGIRPTYRSVQMMNPDR
jgi:hypothetical protein